MASANFRRSENKERVQMARKYFEQIRSKKRNCGGKEEKPQWWCIVCGTKHTSQDGSIQKVSTIVANAARLPGHFTHQSTVRCTARDAVPERDMRIMQGEVVNAEKLEEAFVNNADSEAGEHCHVSAKQWLKQVPGKEPFQLLLKCLKCWRNLITP
jgi:hypothetical protein